MARLLARASSERLGCAAPVVAAVPWTIVCWIKSSDAANAQNVIVITDTGSNSHYMGISFMGSVGGDPLRGFISDAGGSDTVDTTTGYTAGVWHHAGFVAKAANDRAILIDGGSKGTTSASHTPAGLDETIIGAWGGSAGYFDFLDGLVAEAAILKIAATDYQVWRHAQGVPAPLVWPGWAIAAYYPLFETDRDFPTGRYNMTPYNTPGWAPHPPRVLEYWRRYRRRR